MEHVLGGGRGGGLRRGDVWGAEEADDDQLPRLPTEGEPRAQVRTRTHRRTHACTHALVHTPTLTCVCVCVR